MLDAVWVYGGTVVRKGTSVKDCLYCESSTVEQEDGREVDEDWIEFRSG